MASNNQIPRNSRLQPRSLLRSLVFLIQKDEKLRRFQKGNCLQQYPVKEMPNQVDDHEPVVPADAKPRFKWTQQLHQCFVDAVAQLGGADTTPKAVLRVMAIPGISLYHLKSHLQKYRLAKNKARKAINIVHYSSAYTMAADYRPKENETPYTQHQFHNSRSTLQLQMEAQMKLLEQIEVQKHLQVRIEAQGKYLQSVISKAEETLASYSLNSTEVEAATSELSELVSEFPSLSPKRFLDADCSTDSCLTSSDIVELQNKCQHNLESSSNCSNNWSSGSNDINPCDIKKGEENEIDLNS